MHYQISGAKWPQPHIGGFEVKLYSIYIAYIAV